jgi:hypothetical protein
MEFYWNSLDYPIVIWYTRFGILCAIALVVLALSGCHERSTFHYCSYEEGDKVLISSKLFIKPVLHGLVQRVTSDRDGCWYSVRILDAHIHPDYVLVKEERILGKM